jgi:thiol-disulfide isomerase/thioredoxin
LQRRLTVRHQFIFILTITACAGLLMGNGTEQSGDQKFQEELRRAQSLLQIQQYNEAIRAFMRANQLKDNRSADCHLGIAQAYFELESFPLTIENADQALKYADDDFNRAQAYNLKGSALVKQADEGRTTLAEAERAFHAALQLKPSPPLPIIHFNLGMVLKKLGQRAQAADELKTYLQLESQSDLAKEARQALQDLQNSPRSNNPGYTIPSFSIRTLQGEPISKEDLLGKVVLLDFWATWCGPCRAALPELKKIYEKYSRERQFLMISISADRSAERWEEFVRTARMDWPQYLDRDAKLNRDFNVRGLPTYILVGPDGVIQRRFSGWAPRQDRAIEEEINRSLDSLGSKP